MKEEEDDAEEDEEEGFRELFPALRRSKPLLVIDFLTTSSTDRDDFDVYDR